MTAQRLYMAVWEHDQYGDWDTSDVEWDSSIQAPVGWREYALDVWGTEPREGEYWHFGFKPFFWPKTDVPYKSRSSAQARVDIINRWGGRAVVMECTPQWETVEVANARRKRARLLEKKARLYEQVNAVDEEIAKTRVGVVA